MSILTDIFTSLSNKIRSKLGTSNTYTPVEAISAIDDVYTKGITDTKVGNAGAGDVLSGKTFTNSSTVGEIGTMTNNGAVSQSLNCGGSYTIPAGYHNGSGTVTANSLTSQTGPASGKSAVTAGTMLTGYSGWVNGSQINGTMTNNGAVSQSLNCGGSYTVPAGYHNGSGKVTANSLASQTGVDSGKTAVTAGAMVSGYQGWVNGSKISGTFTGQEKTVTAGTSAASVTPDSGKYLTKVTYNPTPSQSKSASPSTSAQTISPDSGKLLSSVSISAISPQRAAGVAATYTGIDSTGPYVYFPYGWHPNTNSSYGNYTRLTAAQAVTACPKQEKTVTAGTSAASVTPDSGKLLSKVTYNPTPSETKTQAPGTSAINVTPSSGKLLSKVTVSAISPQRSNGTYATSVGINSTAPFVYFPYGWWDNNWNNSSFCYLTAAQAQALHNHSTTYTPTSNSSASDMGVQHNYRYINTNTVYSLGQKAALSRVQNNVDAKTMLSISFRSGDVLKYSDRYFTRTSSRPAYACVIFTDAGYFGYCLISMYSDAFSGTFSTHGELETVQSRTANGYTYYWAAMTSKYPGSINPNAMTLHISGTSTYVGLPWIPTQYKNQYWYAGVDAFVADVLCKI